jgi:hypothetical protein
MPERCRDKLDHSRPRARTDARPRLAVNNHPAPASLQGPEQQQLVALKAKLVAAAKVEDATSAKAALAKFIEIGKIHEPAPDNVYSLNERRNLGAPANREVVAQTRRAQDFVNANARVAAPTPAPAPAPAPAAVAAEPSKTA